MKYASLTFKRFTSFKRPHLQVVEVSIRYLLTLRQNHRDAESAEAEANERRRRAFLERSRQTYEQAMRIGEADLESTLGIVQHRVRWSGLPALPGPTLR